MNFFTEILKGLNIKYTAAFAKALTAEQKGAHTLFGVKKMLNVYGVKISAVRIANKDVAELEYPCIVAAGGYPMLMNSLPKDVEEFKESWDGIALLIEDSDKAHEPQYYFNLFKTAITFSLPYVVILSLLFLGCVSCITSGEVNWYKLLLLLFNGVGAFFSWRTVQGECSSSCSAVIESAASKLFGLYSLGVIGLAFFASNIVAYLSIPAFEPIISLIYAPALIMPIWSVAYQLFIAKAWCKNCLGVQLVLILSFIATLMFNKIEISQLQLLPTLGTLALYVVVFYICNYVYQILQKNKSIPQSLIYNYRRLMKDPGVRKNILESGDVYETQGASEIILNNQTNVSANEMFVILSPFCSHCKTLFEEINGLLSAGKLKEYKVVLLFSPSEHGLPVYGSVICEYQQHGADAAIKLLSNWYADKKKDIKPFEKKFEKYDKSAQYLAEIEREKIWCEKHDFSGVPVLIINSHVVDHSLISGILD